MSTTIIERNGTMILLQTLDIKWLHWL